MIDTLEKNFQTEMEEETRKIKEKFICKRCEYLRGIYVLGTLLCLQKKSRGYYDYTKIKKCKDFKEKKRLNGRNCFFKRSSFYQIKIYIYKNHKETEGRK